MLCRAALAQDAGGEGVMLDAPATATFGFAGNLEFMRNDSNISNFKMHNVAVSLGHTAKF
jgi:hypothetical protein